ncbi:MAG: hypothetical protein KAW17_07965 [Candidatus Eisenbacteria sp.]|nr:hypothetical protein [Candidatus Eisenbacteria bacterium]
MKKFRSAILVGICLLTIGALCLGWVRASDDDPGWTVVVSAQFGPGLDEYTPCKSGSAWGFCVSPSGIYVYDPGQRGRVICYALNGVYEQTLRSQSHGCEAIAALDDHLLLLWEPNTFPVTPGVDPFSVRHYRVSAYNFVTEAWTTWPVTQDPRLGWTENTVAGETRISPSSRRILVLTDFVENSAQLYDLHSQYSFPLVVHGEVQTPEQQSESALRGWPVRGRSERLLRDSWSVHRLDQSGLDTLSELVFGQRYLVSFSLEGHLVLRASFREAVPYQVVDLDRNVLLEWRESRVGSQGTIGPEYHLAPGGHMLYRMRVLREGVEILRRDF